MSFKTPFLPGFYLKRFTEWLNHARITSPKLKISTTASGRRGLFAKEAIKAEEFICTVSRESIITSSHVTPAVSAALGVLPAFGCLSRSSVELALALAAAKMDGESSHFSPWIDVLPERVPLFLEMTPEEAMAACEMKPHLEFHLDDFIQVTPIVFLGCA